MAIKPIGGRSTGLARLLDEAGWSVARLTNEVNREVGAGYISRTTVSEWLNWSRVPRQPLPTVVAHVLSQATGTPVAVSQLWPGVAASPLYVAADHGTGVSWDLAGTKALIADWLQNGGNVFDSDRRVSMAVSGTALTAPAWQYVDRVGDVPAASSFGDVFGASGFSDTKVSPAVLEYFRSLTSAFRRMDDLEGGSRENLRQVRIAVTQVSGYLKHGSFAQPWLAKDMVGVLAELSQIGGWMAYDAERHGLAQRYFRTGLQAASEVGDRNLGAHILACMTYQAVYQHKHADAGELATAAVEASRGAHPAVRSLVSSRLAYSSAARGNVEGFRVALEQAQGYLSTPDSGHGRPAWLYWSGTEVFDAQQAHSLLNAALVSKRGSAKFVSEAESLLSSKISDSSDSPRDTFFHGAWLARAHVKKGDLHRGVAMAETAVGAMPVAVSPRTRGVLRDLDQDLANLRQGSKLPEVRALRQQLQSALAA